MFSLFCVDADCLLGWADAGMSASRISHWGLLPHRRPIRDRATAVSQNKPDQTGVLGSVDSRNYGDIPRQSRPEHTSTACWRKQGYVAPSSTSTYELKRIYANHVCSLLVFWMRNLSDFALHLHTHSDGSCVVQPNLWRLIPRTHVAQVVQVPSKRCCFEQEQDGAFCPFSCLYDGAYLLPNFAPLTVGVTL